MELCLPLEKWEAQWPEWQSRVPQPSPNPRLSSSELQREGTAAPLAEQPQPQGRAQTASWVSPCHPARLTLKPPGKVVHEWESCQAVISQSKRKLKCHSLDICSYNAVHLPHSNFLFCPLISALFVTHLTPFWECFKSDCPSGSITWYFPGCWFSAQAGVFVVTPSHLNAALATAHQSCRRVTYTWLLFTPLEQMNKPCLHEWIQYLIMIWKDPAQRFGTGMTNP